MYKHQFVFFCCHAVHLNREARAGGSSAGDRWPKDPWLGVAMALTAVPVPQVTTFSVPHQTPKNAAILLLGGIFSLIVAFNLAFFRHLRREYASPR